MLFDQDKIAEITAQVLSGEEGLFSPYAARNSEAVRKFPEQTPFRGAFARDRDRIIYSGAFRRYVGKTQVIYFSPLFDEQLTTRINHTVQVSQVARTIGKMLALNLDLIEAIALGHDLGHPPFGHDGEEFLNQLCKESGIGEFHHNVHSLYSVDKIANRGRGMNLTLQVRDGILSHNGETHNLFLIPERGKTEADLENYCEEMKAGKKPETVPMTLEGCVVRFSDVIAYLGQDIEDAVRLGLIRREALPPDCARGLGNTNREIIDKLVKDVILRSYQKDQMAFSPEISELVKKLKDFNYQTIYTHQAVNREREKIKRGFGIIFESLLSEVEKGNTESVIYTHFLNGREDYLKRVKPAEMVRDFIATMTDRYFTYVLKKTVIPELELKNY